MPHRFVFVSVVGNAHAWVDAAAAPPCRHPSNVAAPCVERAVAVARERSVDVVGRHRVVAAGGVVEVGAVTLLAGIEDAVAAGA